VGLLVALQVIVALLPVLIDAGLTEIVTTGIAITVRLAELDPEPAELLQLKLYVNVPAEFIGPVLVLPLPALAPLQLPLAVQDVGLLVALHEIVELLPVPIGEGATEMVTTGATAPPPPLLTPTVVVALSEPPALEQLSV
jgi:hypothetical protein